MSEKVYKIFFLSQWKDFCNSDEFAGSDLDLADGFIHLSSKDQLVETLFLYFPRDRDLVVASFLEEKIETSLRWERSRGGQLFPHLFGILKRSDVVEFFELKKGLHKKALINNGFEVRD